MPGVDVAIPCYQYGRFLRGCVESVLSQGIDDLRVIIIDNASPDDSLEVARQVASEDRRVEVLAHPTNLGPHVSYNEGIAWASADYFLLLDADDLLAPGCLSRAVSIMEDHPEISFTHGVEVRFSLDDGLPDVPATGSGWEIQTGAEFIRNLCRTPVNNVGAPTVVRRTSAQKRVGYYRPELPYTDDLEMWLRLASEGSVAQTASVQALRRVHGSQMSVQFQTAHQVRDFQEREAAFVSFFSREGRSLQGAACLLQDARRGLGEHAYWSAISHVCRGYGRAGLELFEFSRTRRPMGGFLPPIGWLLRMDRPMSRIADIGAETFGWKQQTGRL
ncbi:glycosyltransferase family 2 protein [Microvirga massiliensis]|uniref:glycosyltransferase family 2 protein n=1 Tax=Microvirga massiliensis TaxID=1033741 RepID=UPI00062B8D7B|nr:glycosyltransferase family 2 protein [Microvirga massiliensis]